MAERHNNHEAQVEAEIAAESGVDLMKIQAGFGFTGPLAMRMRAEEVAAERKLPLSTWLRNVIAREIGFHLPAEKTTRGLTPEEKKRREDEAKAKAKEERKLVKSLLDQHKKEITPEKPAEAEGAKEEVTAAA